MAPNHLNGCRGIFSPHYIHKVLFGFKIKHWAIFKSNIDSSIIFERYVSSPDWTLLDSLFEHYFDLQNLFSVKWDILLPHELRCIKVDTGRVGRGTRGWLSYLSGWFFFATVSLRRPSIYVSPLSSSVRFTEGLVNNGSVAKRLSALHAYSLPGKTTYKIRDTDP